MLADRAPPGTECAEQSLRLIRSECGGFISLNCELATSIDQSGDSLDLGPQGGACFRAGPGWKVTGLHPVVSLYVDGPLPRRSRNGDNPATC